MKKKGYLLLELIIYLALGSMVILSVMNINIFLLKNYNRELKKDKYEIDLLNIDLLLTDLMDSSEVFRVDLYNEVIDIFYMKNNRLYQYRIGNAIGGSVYLRRYRLDENYEIIKVDEERMITKSSNKLKFLEKENLIYLIINSNEGEEKVLIYEKKEGNIEYNCSTNT